MDRRPRVSVHVDVDLWDPATFASGIPYEEFAVLRSEAPIAWHEEHPRREGGRSGPGFWCVTTHADVQTVSTQPDIYLS